MITAHLLMCTRRTHALHPALAARVRGAQREMICIIIDIRIIINK